MPKIRVVNFKKSLIGNNGINFIECYYDFCETTYGFIPSKSDKIILRGFIRWMGQVFDEVEDLEGEEWKLINWKPKRYFISNMGRVKYKQLVNHRYRRIKIHNRGIRKGSPYWVELLDDEGVIKKRLIHKLMWSAFKGRVPKGYRIEFIDDNPSNCRLDNLKIVLRDHKRTI